MSSCLCGLLSCTPALGASSLIIMTLGNTLICRLRGKRKMAYRLCVSTDNSTAFGPAACVFRSAISRCSQGHTAWPMFGWWRLQQFCGDGRPMASWACASMLSKLHVLPLHRGSKRKNMKGSAAHAVHYTAYSGWPVSMSAQLQGFGPAAPSARLACTVYYYAACSSLRRLQILTFSRLPKSAERGYRCNSSPGLRCCALSHRDHDETTTTTTMLNSSTHMPACQQTAPRSHGCVSSLDLA